jgi:hypothetical protein
MGKTKPEKNKLGTTTWSTATHKMFIEVRPNIIDGRGFQS